jgi:reverse gyrase
MNRLKKLIVGALNLPKNVVYVIKDGIINIFMFVKEKFPKRRKILEVTSIKEEEIKLQEEEKKPEKFSSEIKEVPAINTIESKVKEQLPNGLIKEDRTIDQVIEEFFEQETLDKKNMDKKGLSSDDEDSKDFESFYG